MTIRKLSALFLTAVVFVPWFIWPGVLYPEVMGRAVLLRCLVVVALLAALATTFSGSTRRIRLSGDPVFWSFAAFVLLSVTAAVAGVAPRRSLSGTMERMWGVAAWAPLLALYALLRSVLTEREWRRILGVSLAVSAAVATYAVLQQAGDAALRGWIYGAGRGRAYGTLGNAGYLAGYALLHLAVAGLLWRQTAGLGRRALLTAAVVLNAWAFWLTATRAATAGLVLGGLLAMAVAGLRWRRLPSGWVAAGVGAVVLLLVGLILLPRDAWLFEVSPALERLTAFPPRDFGLRMRFLAWSAAAEGIRDSPLLGVGPENFHVLHHRFFQPVEYTIKGAVGQFDRAHNAFLEPAATSGLPAGVAYLAVWGSLFWSLHRGWRRGGLSGPEALVLGGGFVAYAFYLLFWFEDHNSTLVFVLLAAYVGRRAYPEGWPAGPGPGRRGGIARWIVVPAALACGAFLYSDGYNLLRASGEAAEARTEEDPWEGAARFRRALDARPAQARDVALAYARFVGRMSGWIALRSRSDSSFRRRAEREVGRALEAVGARRAAEPTAFRLQTQEYRLNRLAHRVTGRGRYLEAAERPLERALRLAPRRIRLYHRLADLELARGNPGRAHRHLDRALAIYGGYGETYLYRARVRWQQGRRAAAEKDLYRALSRSYRPPAPDVVLEVGGWLEDAERHADAGRLYLLYLAVKYPRLGRAAPTEEALRKGYELPDWRVAYHLPLVQLRADRPDDARRSARRLLRVLEAQDGLSEQRRAVRAFLEDLEAGRLERWGDAGSVASPPPTVTEPP